LVAFQFAGEARSLCFIRLRRYRMRHLHKGCVKALVLLVA
jgi:hypothetical protein